MERWLIPCLEQQKYQRKMDHLGGLDRKELSELLGSFERDSGVR